MRMPISTIVACASMVATMLMAACSSHSDDVPMEKLVSQYKAVVAGRHIGHYMELTNLKISHVRCDKGNSFTLCKVDATGDLLIRDSLAGKNLNEKLDDKDIELKFFSIHK